MPWAVEYGARRKNVLCSGRCQNLRGAGNAVLHHSPGVLADRVVDLGGRDPVAVLEHRVERHTVVLFRQVLASDTHQRAVVEERAVDAVMIPAPGKPSSAVIGDGLVGGAGAASELQGVAP